MSEAPISIWLLEDSRLEATVVQRALGDDFDIEWFSDGESLLEQLAHRQPRLLILDAQLPGISGIEVCTFVRSRFDELTLPVLFLTAHESRADVVAVLTAGANDYVRKPFNPAELRARVLTLARLANAQDSLTANLRRAQLAAEVGAALTRGVSMGAELQVCAEAIVRHVEVTSARVWTLAPKGEFLELQASAGSNDLDRVAGCGRISLGEPAIGRIASERTPHFTNDPLNDPRVRSSELAALRGVGAFAAYPLLVEGRAVGVLALFARKPIPEATISDIATVAHMLAIGIDRAHAENERIRLLESERRAREQAERSNRAKDEFLSMVSHELRTPLNAMLGWARMLSQGLAGGSAQRGLETIERNAAAQAKLIDDLLDVSRITTGKLRLDIQAFDPVRVVQAAVDSVRPAIEGKEQSIVCDLERFTGVMMGDGGRLQQVAWNLLSNAVKFTPKYGAITVVLRRVDSHVELSVSDTGEGVRTEFLPYVFERFEQQDGSAARRHGGLGLGLAICRHIVELHGGSIHAFSDGEGAGATFLVKLPIGVAPALQTAPFGASGGDRARVSFDCPPELRGLSVLVVDDDRDARELVAFILTRCGASPTVASTPDEAMQVVQRVRPDVLVSDVGMPGQDGYAFIRSVRSLPASSGGQTPAAVLTAYARTEDRRQALEAGYQMHVSKPVEPSELVAVVAALARIARASKPVT